MNEQYRAVPMMCGALTLGLALLWAGSAGAATLCGNGVQEPGETAIDCPRDFLVDSISILRLDAVHGSFSPSGERIAIDVLAEDGRYDVHVMDLEGKTVRDLTGGGGPFGDLNQGWPVWHPSGQLIVFQAEVPEHLGVDLKNLAYLGMPAYGFYNNLWATTPDGDRFWQLTDVPIKKTAGDAIPATSVVNAKFSPDGRQMVWTCRMEGGGTHDWGYWEVHIANVAYDAEKVSLNDERVLIRAKDVCPRCNYVNAMGFFPNDENKLLLSGNLDGQHPFGMDQYVLDLESGELTNLLRTPETWEEGSCISPDGSKIVFQSNLDSPYPLDFERRRWEGQPRTREWYMLDLESGRQGPLTAFNRSGSKEHEEIAGGRRMITAKCNFSPDGKTLIGIVGIDREDPDNAEKATFRLALGEVRFK